MTWRFARSWPHMAHQDGAFKVNCCMRGVCLPPALTKSHRQIVFDDFAPKLRSWKCDAGNLASFSHLHKSYTVCRSGIHLSRLSIRQMTLSQAVISSMESSAYRRSAAWHGSCDSVNARGRGAVAAYSRLRQGDDISCLLNSLTTLRR